MSDETKKPKELLNVQEEMFARHMTRGKNQTQAMQAANPSLTPGSASVIGSKLMKRPRVRERIIELLDEKYPDHENDYVRVVKHALKLALESDDLDKVTKLMTEFGKLAGYQAPTKSQSLSAKVMVPKLPSDNS